MEINRLRGEQLDRLFEAILTLETKEECYQFFDDLATMNEISSLSQRLEVARLLLEGHTYNHIEEKTKASTATISRVRRCIDYGSGGYKIVFERLADQSSE